MQFKSQSSLLHFYLASLASFAFIQNHNHKNSIRSLFSQKGNPNTKTYIWGNGTYQARPDALIQFKNWEPKLIESFQGGKNPNMKEIAFGEYFVAGIDSTSNLRIWKKHKLSSSREDNSHDNQRELLQNLENSKDIKQVAFTKSFLWGLKHNGEVFQWPIQYEYDEDYHDEIKSGKIIEKPRLVKSLKNIKQISTGEDHFAALDSHGDLYTMGDDTYGQCGTNNKVRSSAPPFTEERIHFPKKVEFFDKIKKVMCGGNHTLILSENGKVFGFGSNSNLQLSHQKEFSQVENPLIAIFKPEQINYGMENNIIEDIAAGDEFSVFVTRNKVTDESEVFSCGRNLHGELGIGYLKHVSEISKIETISNYKIQTDEGEKNIRIQKLECGKNHCIAQLNIGVLLEWGSNEYGQLGNKKRTFSENPLILSQFQKENVVNFNCQNTNSAVFVEDRDGNKK